MKKIILTILFALFFTTAFALDTVKFNPNYYPNPDRGKPVSYGAIYVGLPDLDPTIAANQKTLSVKQEDGTIVAVSQPIYTSAGGVPQYLGSPVTLLVAGDYSLMVLDAYDSQIYYMPDSGDNSSTFYPEYTEVDQGVDGGGGTLKYYADLIGSDSATIVLRNNSGDARTAYTITTALDLPSNIKLEFENGAYIDKQGDFTINHPDNLAAVNPMWFGAKFDGLTDDSTAWQNCIDSFPVRGGDIRPPSGVSVLDSGLFWPVNGSVCYQINIIGQTVAGNFGPNFSQTEIRFTDNSGTLFSFRGESGTESYSYLGKIQGLALSGPATSSALGTSVAIKIKDMAGGVLKDMIIRDFKYGIETNGYLYYSQIEHITFYNCYTSFFGNTGLFNGTVLKQLKISGKSNTASDSTLNRAVYGIHLRYPGQVTIQGCWFEKLLTYGAFIRHGSVINLINNYFEYYQYNNTVSHVKIDSDENGASNMMLYASGNIFSRTDTVRSMDIENCPVVCITGNNFGSGKSDSGFTIALSFVDPLPSGIVAGNVAPTYSDGIVASSADLANCVTGSPLSRNVGLASRYPFYDTLVKEGSFFFNSDHDKGVLGWQAINSGAGTAASLNGGATTATTTVGSNEVSVSSVIDVYVGCAVKVAGETFNSGDTFATVKRVISSPSTIVLDKTADNGVSGASMSSACAHSPVNFTVTAEVVSIAAVSTPCKTVAPSKLCQLII